MGLVFRLIITTLIVAAVVTGGSLAWPRFTARARPKILQEIHDAVIKTPVGKQTANVLGVTDEKHTTPVNVNQMITTAVTGAKDAIQDRARTVIIQNAINQLNAQLDQLPKEEKQQIQEMLCKPPVKP